MTGFTDYVSQGVLNHITGRAAIFSKPTAYVALFTAMGSDAGTGFTEVSTSGTAYARVATTSGTWNSASGSAPSSTSNSGNVAYAQATSGWGTIVGFGLYDAPTGGNLLDFDWLGNYPYQPFTNASGASGVITAPAHGYANGDQVIFTSEYGGALPTGMTAETLYTVENATTNSFDVGLNLTTIGNGMVRKVATQAIASGVTASFSGGTPGALVLTSA